MFDERKLKSLKRASQAIAALSIVVFFALLGYGAYKLYSINKDIAEKTKKAADLEATSKSRQKEIDDLELKIQSKQDEIAKLELKSNALSEVIANADQQSVRQAVNEIIMSKPLTAAALPRIYIQIRDEAQRRGAQYIASKLQENGFIVPDIENVGDKTSGSTTLKYFRQNPDEAADVKKIVEILQSEKVKTGIQYISGFEASNKIRSRHYELWCGSDFSPPRPIKINPKAGQQKDIR